MKILSIGNSFSQDAQTYLHDLAPELYCVNLYIPGCSLELHWHNAVNDKAAYMRQENGAESDEYVSIKTALLEEKWDIVTLQQASHDSGILVSFSPYIEQLSGYVTALAPQARQLIHETWAYEQGSSHEAFGRYENSQAQMYAQVHTAYHECAQRLGLQVIPVGEVIQTLRALPEFDVTAGGRSLCRDGYHLSLAEGRYAAAATWGAFLTGNLQSRSFLPESADGAVIAQIKNVVEKVVKHEN